MNLWSRLRALGCLAVLGCSSGLVQSVPRPGRQTGRATWSSRRLARRPFVVVASRQLVVSFHGGGHGHAHGHGHNHARVGGLPGLSAGALARAGAVGALLWFLPLPCLTRGACADSKLQGTLAICMGLFLVAVEASKGVLTETRSRLSQLYLTFLAHQASARAGGLVGGVLGGGGGFGGDVSGGGGTGQVSQLDAKEAKEANRVTVAGAVLNVVLSVFKLGVGFSCSSAAMVADAGHSFSDLLSDLVTLATLRLSRLPPDDDHPYGHGRFEALGALLIAALLWSTAVGFGGHAYASLLAALAADPATQAVSGASALATTEAVGRATSHASATAAFSVAASAAKDLGAAARVGAVCRRAAGGLGVAAARLPGLVGGALFHGHHHHHHSHHLARLGPAAVSAAAASGVAASAASSAVALGLRAQVLALCAACVSIATKEALFLATFMVGTRINSSVLIANAWHHRSDAFSSVVALVGILGGVLGFPLLDPLAGLGVAGMVAATGAHVAWDAVKQLTDTVDAPAADQAWALATKVPGVTGVDRGLVRARRMGSSSVVDLRVAVARHVPASGANRVAEDVRRAVLDGMPHVSEVLVRTDAEEKGCPLVAFAARGADAIEADVRRALEASSVMAWDAAQQHRPRGLGSLRTPRDRASGEAVSPVHGGWASSGHPVGVRVSAVHRVTVHYASLQPEVEVLLGVEQAPHAGGCDGAAVLSGLRELGERAATAVRVAVPDVAACEVHMRLASRSDHRQRTQKALGHTAHRRWARLLLGRARDLIIHGPTCSPASYGTSNGATIQTDEDGQYGHFLHPPTSLPAASPSHGVDSGRGLIMRTYIPQHCELHQRL